MFFLLASCWGILIPLLFHHHLGIDPLQLGKSPWDRGSWRSSRPWNVPGAQHHFTGPLTGLEPGGCIFPEGLGAWTCRDDIPAFQGVSFFGTFNRNENSFRVFFGCWNKHAAWACLWLIRNINHVPFWHQPHTFEVGTHPNILRLLESYQASTDGVVLLVVVVVVVVVALVVWRFLVAKKCQNCQKQLATPFLGRASTVKMCLSWSTVMVPPSTTFMLGNTLRLGYFRVRWFPSYHPGGHLNVGDSPKSSDVRFNLDLQKLKWRAFLCIWVIFEEIETSTSCNSCI